MISLFMRGKFQRSSNWAMLKPRTQKTHISNNDYLLISKRKLYWKYILVLLILYIVNVVDFHKINKCFNSIEISVVYINIICIFASSPKSIPKIHCDHLDRSQKSFIFVQKIAIEWPYLVGLTAFKFVCSRNASLIFSARGEHWYPFHTCRSMQILLPSRSINYVKQMWYILLVSWMKARVKGIGRSDRQIAASA